MKRIIFLIFSIILFIFAFIQAKPVEVELMKAFISPHSAAEGYLVKLANLSSKKVNIIFEASSLDELEENGIFVTKNEFLELFNACLLYTSPSPRD